MARETFERLIEAFCVFSNLPEPERIFHGDPIDVNGIVFSLVHNEELNPEVIFIYCDFGEIPTNRKTEILEALLEANLLLYSGPGPVLSISPETKRVVCADHYRLNDITPEGLHSILSNIAAMAKDWRTNYLLSPSSNGAAGNSIMPSQMLRL